MKKIFLLSLFFVMLALPARADSRAEFFAAVRNGDSDRVERMIARDKALVFITDENGMTPFLTAVQSRNGKMVYLLFDYFARLGDTGGPGNAFHIAVQNEDEAMVRLLVQMMSEDDPQMPKYLLNMRRTPTNSKSNDKNTPLHLAALKCNFAIYQLLLKNGANPALRNAAGKTPRQILSACPKPAPKAAGAAGKPAFGAHNPPTRKRPPLPEKEEPVVFPIL